MASLALGLAGAGIGNFLLPGIGGSLGWAIGATIGSRLGRKSHQSPQIKDLRVQTSEYGTPIPIGFGTIRIAGWLEWAADKVPHKVKSGGKGGPKVSTTTYTCSFAIGLTETSFLDGAGLLVNNPIVGILRIWANGRLVWGDGSPADALPMTIYYGTEDQMPDPTWEADKGVGQVNANRGKSYVVFENLELGPYGDAIPNFTFEVVASGEIGLEYYALWPVDWSFPDDGLTYAHPNGLSGVDSSVGGQLTLHRYRSGQNYGAPYDPSNAIFYDRRVYDLDGNLIAEIEDQIVSALGGGAGVYASMNSGIAYASWSATYDCTEWLGSEAGSTDINTFAWLKDGVVTYTPAIDTMCMASFDDGPILPDYVGFVALDIYNGGVYWNGNYYVCAGNGGNTRPRILRFPAPDGAVYTPTPDAEYDLSTFTTNAVSSGTNELFIGDGYLWCRFQATELGDPPVTGGIAIKLIKFDADLNNLAQWFTSDAGVGATLGQPGYSSAVVWHGHYITYMFFGSHQFRLYRMGPSSMTLVDSIAAENVYPGAPEGQKLTPLIHIAGSPYAAFRGGILTLGSGTITLAEMVANVSQHVGYAEDEYDVSQLTDVVRGACISQRTSGRAAIEAWQPAYQFGAVESNFANKFVKWSGTAVATVPEEDLGAREYGTEPGDPIRRTLTTDKDLPRTVEVVFLNKTMDYQEGMQYWEGPVQSDLHVALSMALVFTDAEAKAIADNIGVVALVEREKFTFSLPRKWAHLEPTDVIELGDKPIRIINKHEEGYTHILYEGISTRLGEWITAPVASEVVYVPQAPTVTMKTDLLLLDTALARGSDYQLGFNVAVAGTMDGPWPGAGLFKSIDGGANYESIAAMVGADTFGVATTILGDFGGGNIVDEINVLTVRLSAGSGELASTNYLGLINGGNLFALGTTGNGYELAQFRDATLISSTSGGVNTYELSGLLRGRRGTEWAMAGHFTDDKFVLLPAHNIDGTFDELGAERLYKAVTAGATLSSATAVAFTNNGAALAPYAPVQIGGGRNAAGDILIHWSRRTRLGGGWANNVEVPLGEDSEYYSLTFYTDATYATVVATVFSATPSYTYVAADQTTDFGGLEAPLHVGIRQLGTYGYGTEGRAII